MDKTLELVPYDPAWPSDFGAERDRIAAVLGGLDISPPVCLREG